MVEIYNEQVRDLLSSNGPQKRYPFPLSIVYCQTHHNSGSLVQAFLSIISYITLYIYN